MGDPRSPEDDPLAPTLLPDAHERAPTEPARSDRALPAGATTDPALAATITPAEASGLRGVVREGATLTAEHPGRYRRESEIGRGGMGRVVLVHDAHLGREVAMKELLSQQGGSDAALSIGAVARFLREARITGQLEHPGIVPVHELGQRADGTIYYTMKRIRGRSLASVLREKGAGADALPARLELVRAFRDVCEAIAYAHSRGVVHRDLKPDNVMVGEFGETLVVDWGLAKVRGDADPRAAEIERRVQLLRGADAAQTVDGHAIGTPAYMSPEQARGDVDTIDERTDVWGLGAILFEILTGRAPYVGQSAMDVLSHVLEDPAPRARQVLPEVPPELAAIADRALMKDPSSRYPGAAELAAEIAAWEDGRNVRAYEYSSLELVRRFVKRNRAGAIAAAVIAFSIVAASALVYRSYLSEQHARASAERRRDEAVAERERALESATSAEIAVAEALLERAERALEDGDPAGAAIHAAGALVRDPASPGAHAREPAHGDEAARRRASERVVRAFSLYVEAEAARQYAFERRIGGAHARGALSTSGRTLAVPTESGIRLVDLGTGEERRVDVRAERVRALDDAGVAVIAGTAPGVYDLTSGARLRETPPPSGASIAAGRIAVACSGGDVVVVSADGASEIDRFETTHHAHAQAIWSPSGDRLAVTSTDALEVELWDWPRGAEPVRIAVPAPPYTTSFSPRGDRLAILVTDAALVLATLGPTPRLTEIPMRGWATSTAWDAAGLIATLEDGDRIAVRDPETGAPVETLHVPASSGGRIESGGDRLVYLPLPGTGAASVFRRVPGAGRDVVTFDNASRDFVLDEARRRIVVATLRAVLSVEIGRQRLGAVTVLGELPADAGMLSRIAVASDGAVAAITHRGALVLLDPDGAAPRVVRPPSTSPPSGVLAVAFDPSGDTVLSGSPEGGAIRRWLRSRNAEGTPLEGHTAPVASIAFSPDGSTIASGSLDDTVRLWDADSGRSLRTIEGHEDLAADVAFSPDGELVASVDGHGWLRVHRVRDGAPRGSVRVHDRWINHVGWSSDGRHLVTASDDRSVRITSAGDMSVVRIFRTRGAPITAALSSDGTHLVHHDGRDLVRSEPRLAFARGEPERLLAEAQRRTGMRLEGLSLVAIEE